MRLRTNLFAAAGIVLALASSGLAQRGNNPPILPDPKMTPGDALDVTKADICVSGYTKKVRNVPQAVKNQVYQEYGITSHAPGEYEVDHLISLELGGNNSIKNLWPELYKSEPWNAHVKDALENELHSEICSGKIDIKTAQQDIARDWIAAYKKYFHTDQPLTKARNGRRTRSEKNASASAPTGATDGQVWVNTKSGAYWRPGTRYFGKTKEGKYMTESEAIKAGYHTAGGGTN